MQIEKAIELGCVVSIIEMYQDEFSDEMKIAISKLVTTIAENTEETSGQLILKHLFEKYGVEFPE